MVPHQGSSTQLNYALHVCFSHRQLFKEVRSPPSIYPSHFLRSKEVEVRDKFPAHFLSPSVCLSVITGCVLRCFLVVVFWNFVSPLATAPILPTTCTVLAGSEPSSTAPKAPLSASSRARDPRTPSTAPKAPLLARKASRALHI